MMVRSLMTRRRGTYTKLLRVVETLKSNTYSYIRQTEQLVCKIQPANVQKYNDIIVILSASKFFFQVLITAVKRIFQCQTRCDITWQCRPGS